MGAWRALGRMDRQMMLGVLLQENFIGCSRAGGGQMCLGQVVGVNPLPQKGFPQAALGMAGGEEPQRSLGEDLFVCSLGQNASEKLLPGVRSEFLDGIQSISFDARRNGNTFT